MRTPGHDHTASDPPPRATPPQDAGSPAVRVVEVLRRGAAGPSPDCIAVELPLEVCLGGEPFSVIMRTPGADRDLALGFLFSENVIHRAADVQDISVDEDAGRVDVVLREPARAARFLQQRRRVTTSSSCGMCGRPSAASLGVDAPRCTVEWRIAEDAIAGLPGALRAAQRAFAATGGIHAAGLFDLAGRLEASAEDVGRHNAVDALIGRMLQADRLPLGRSLLFVSGRSSFEIVQKAWLAGVPFVAAVSAPSTLAVDLAREAGMTLLGFVRDGGFNVYAAPERIHRPGADWGSGGV